MTARAAAVAELIRTALAAADQLIGTLVSHLRAARHESVSPLGELPTPDESPRDPRAARKRLHFAGDRAHPEVRSAIGRPAALTELGHQPRLREQRNPMARDDANQSTLKRDEHWFRLPVGAPVHRRVIPSGGGR